MNKRSGSEERMAEGSAEAKRRKIAEYNFHENNEIHEEESMEICSDDVIENENFWATLPPEVVDLVFSRLPYETIAQLALPENGECIRPREWNRIEFTVLERGMWWARTAERKWLAWKCPPVSGLDEAFVQRVKAAWPELLSAFRYAITWKMDRDDIVTARFPYNFRKLGRELDQAERCHRDMAAMVAFIEIQRFQQ